MLEALCTLAPLHPWHPAPVLLPSPFHVLISRFRARCDARVTPASEDPGALVTTGIRDSLYRPLPNTRPG